MLTRRSFLAQSSSLLATTGFLGSAGALAGAPANSLSLYGPPAGPSIILSYIAQKGLLGEHVENVDFSVFKSPDVMRAGILSGNWKLTGTPSYVAANLYNKGLPVKLLNIMTWGLLYVLSYDGEIKKPADLAGQTIGMFYRNDMPDLVLSSIMEQHGLKAGTDYQLHYVSTAFEALKLLMAGRIKHCVLPEPVATGGLLKAAEVNKKVYRVIDLADEWFALTGGKARFPMAGMIVHDDLLEKRPELVSSFHEACVKTVKWVKANPEEAARISGKHLKLPPQVIAQSIPKSNLSVEHSVDVRSELEAFYSILAQKNPQIIGGKLPEANFYL